MDLHIYGQLILGKDDNVERIMSSRNNVEMNRIKMWISNVTSNCTKKLLRKGPYVDESSIYTYIKTKQPLREK